MPAPVRGSSAGRAATFTMRPPCGIPLSARAAAQEATDDIGVELGQQMRLVRLGDRLGGKATGQMDRGPDRSDFGVERIDLILIGQFDAGIDRHALPLRARTRRWRARRYDRRALRCDQGVNNSIAEGAGPARDDNATPAEIQALLPSALAARRQHLMMNPVANFARSNVLVEYR